MDELASHRQSAGPDDLASIVLRSARDARPGPVVGPERVPVEWRLRQETGFEARSVLVLALVVALLAALGGWLTSIGDEPLTASASDRTERADAASEEAAESSTDHASETATAAPTTDDRPAAVRGIDLAVGRVVAERSSTGSGVVRVGITNAGDQPYAGRIGVSLLLLLDGDVIATEQVPPLEAGASTRMAVQLGWCPAGTLPVTAVLDPGAAVREGDERNNAMTQSASFNC